MRRLFFLTTLFVMFGLASCESNKKSNPETKSFEDKKTHTFDYEKELTLIKMNFKRINAFNNWTVIDSIEINETSEGGFAKFYYANKKLQKIVARYFGERAQKIYEFYLLEGELSFVYEKEFTYNRPIYWDESLMNSFEDSEHFDFEKATIIQTRYYFSKNILFEQIITKKDSKEVLQTNLEKKQKEIQTIFKQLTTQSLVRQIK